MSIVPNKILSGAGLAMGYLLQRSLRFRASASAYLNRTAVSSATNNYIGTWSFWCKRGKLGAAQRLFEGGYPGGTDATVGEFYFDSSDKFVFAGYATTWRTSNQVFRDTSAWYHFVVTVDTTQATANNRVRVYVNGSEITSWATLNNPTQNTTFGLNNNSVSLVIAADSYGLGQRFDGYLAEVNFIDGQALTPSSFGQTDAVTGVWTPKKYTGTYGTNGFYLPFSNNTSATTLAYDASGNGNNWTPNNISTTAGATYDSMTDVPTLTSATAANYCVLNPLDNNTNTINDGNLGFVTSNAAFECSKGSMYVSSGKWYWEVVGTSSGNNGAYGIMYGNTYSTVIAYSGLTGNKAVYGTQTAYGSTFTNNNVIGVAIDLDSATKTITFYKDNVSQGAITITNTEPVAAYVGDFSGTANVTGSINFGQRPFSYTPPTGFKALNTFNLPDPVIKKPNQYMDATLYTGTGASLSITNAAGFQPDLVWAKGRSGATDHALYDSVRGVQKQLESNNTGAETTETTGLTAFNSNGFTVGALAQVNTNTATYVGWQWKESATAGFDIVTFNGTGAAQNVSHSLGVAPSMMIVKQRSATGDWWVYHKYANANPQNGTLWLNLTNAWTGPASYWNNTAPTSSVFTVGAAGGLNANGVTQIAYLFAEIAGFSKFGSYTGNGSADGPFVYCGFRPKYVMVKCSSAAENWYVEDASRDTYNVASRSLEPNLSNAELSSTSYYVDFLSNGFKLRTADTSWNYNGQTMIYAVFAQNPFKYANAR